MRPKLFMMIGLPGSGKSTFIEHFPWDFDCTNILSTDDYIEDKAAAESKTYNEAFRDHIKAAEEYLEESLNFAVKYCEDHIIWDQTNLSKKTRARKLAKIPAKYEKIAIVCIASEDDLNTRREQREGKTIPAHILKSMAESFEYPTKEEGFDFIYEVRT